MTERDNVQPRLVLPANANDYFEQSLAPVGERGALALYLDFDGTLVPIVARPEDVLLPDSLRVVLQRLAAVVPVALVSGRDRKDVARHVGIDGLIYAGSHGNDICGPGIHFTVGDDHLASLDGAEHWLRDRLAGVKGALVERKRFGVALHTRLVEPASHQLVEDVARAALAAYPGLKLTDGKEVLELRPDLAWDKGRAVLKLQQVLSGDGIDRVPLFIGDDVTDEDAIAAIADQGAAGGIAIRVTDVAVATQAHWRLDDPGDVARYLTRLCDHLGA